MRIKILFILSFFTLTTIYSQTFTWTGDVNSASLYEEGNWKDNGVSPSQIDPNVHRIDFYEPESNQSDGIFVEVICEPNLCDNIPVYGITGMCI